MKELDQKKPVVLTGDLNVAHEEIDIKNPQANIHNAGFTKEERDKFTRLLSNGFVDSYRRLYPDQVKYSWWSYRFNARASNAGWRIDYFVVSERLMGKVLDSKILNDVLGSDHCPVELDVSAE
jgi:exodeoxyribonuclease-3